jgi:hypothetical protein
MFSKWKARLMRIIIITSRATRQHIVYVQLTDNYGPWAREALALTKMAMRCAGGCADCHATRRSRPRVSRWLHCKLARRTASTDSTQRLEATDMMHLVVAGVVLFVSTLVTIMVWPLSSRSRWNPSGRVRLFAPIIPRPNVVDRDRFSTATSLAAQLALAWHWLFFSRRMVLTCLSSHGTKRISKRRSRGLRYLTSSGTRVCRLYSSTGITGQP